MKLNKITKTILTLVFFISITSAFAQAPVEPDPVVDDPGAPLDPAPIGDYILPMLVLGVVTAYFLLRKKATASLS